MRYLTAEELMERIEKRLKEKGVNFKKEGNRFIYDLENGATKTVLVKDNGAVSVNTKGPFGGIQMWQGVKEDKIESVFRAL